MCVCVRVCVTQNSFRSGVQNPELHNVLQVVETVKRLRAINLDVFRQGTLQIFTQQT
jgi:hypothetical protein